MVFLVSYGMVFQGKCSVCFFNLILACLLGYAQYLIEIFLLSHYQKYYYEKDHHYHPPLHTRSLSTNLLIGVQLHEENDS